MFHPAARGEVKRFGAAGDRRRESGALLFHRTEEGGELVEVVLAPLLVRMMVAFGAFQACAEEELAEHRGQLRRLAAVTINHRRAIAMVAAFGQEDFTHQLVVRFVLPETLAQPLVQDENALHPDTVRVGAQQVGPFVGPVIGIRRILQHLRDKPVALLGRRVVQKGAHFLGRGQQPDGIEFGAAEKLSIGAQVGGKQPELLEVRISQGVDEIIAGQRGVLGLGQQGVGGHEDLRVGNKANVARDDHALAGERADVDDAALVHLGDLLVVLGKGGEAGHVAHAGVGVMRLHEQTLRRSFAVAPLFWEDREALEHRLVGQRIGHALAQPADEQLVGLRAALEAQTSLVRQRHGRLLEQEAFVGRRWEHAPAPSLLDDLGIVGFRIVGEDRQLETVLPFGFRVARASVAARLAQRRQNVAEERNGWRAQSDAGNRRPRIADFHRNLHAPAFEVRGQHSFARSRRQDFAEGRDFKGRGVVRRKPDLIGHIDRKTVTGFCGDQHPMTSGVGGEPELLRLGAKRDDGRRFQSPEQGRGLITAGGCQAGGRAGARPQLGR